MGGTAPAMGIGEAGVSTAVPKRLCQTRSVGARCSRLRKSAAATRSSAFEEKFVFAKSPSLPPSPVKSKRSTANPFSASAALIAAAALLSLEQVKQWAKMAYASGGPAGASSRAASDVPNAPGKVTGRLLGAICAPAYLLRHGDNRRDMSSCAHGPEAPSAWVCRWAALIRPGGRVLDVACGQGRHLRYLQSLGFAVVGVDRDAQALSAVGELNGAEVCVADIEAGPWPFAPGGFDGVVESAGDRKSTRLNSSH